MSFCTRCVIVLGVVLAVVAVLATDRAIAAATWTVDAGGGGDALTIAGGVALATEGDTIRIAAGAYQDVIAIEKGIHFIGFGGTVIWEGNGTASCLSVENAAGFSLEGITFQGGGGEKGGGLYAANLYPAGVTVVGCTFRSMTVSETAAGIYTTQAGALTVESCAFRNLGATGSWAGAVFSGSGGSTFLGCEFVNCSGVRGGGLCVFNSDNLIEECTFDGCEANFAGALNLYGANTTTIRNCTFTGNHAFVAGGAIELSASGHTIENNLFRDNSSATGGAINAFSGSANTIQGNLFVTNTASARGGAIQDESALEKITGNTFYGNSSPEGAAVGGFSGSPTIDQNIFAGQTGYAIYCAALTPVIGCNDFWQNSAGDGFSCTIEQGDGNIFFDPMFCDAPAGDFSIHSDSPCGRTHVPLGCERMGAKVVGCGDTPARPTTWGQVRALFR